MSYVTHTKFNGHTHRKLRGKKNNNKQLYPS